MFQVLSKARSTSPLLYWKRFSIPAHSLLPPLATDHNQRQRIKQGIISFSNKFRQGYEEHYMSNHINNLDSHRDPRRKTPNPACALLLPPSLALPACLTTARTHHFLCFSPNHPSSPNISWAPLRTQRSRNDGGLPLPRSTPTIANS